jgi:hypothetical protein
MKYKDEVSEFHQMGQHFSVSTYTRKSRALPAFPNTYLNNIVAPGPNVAGFMVLIFVFRGFQYRPAGMGKQEVG